MTRQTDILKSKLLKVIFELFLVRKKQKQKTSALKRLKKKSNVFPFPLSHLERYRRLPYGHLRTVAYEIHLHGAADAGHPGKKPNMRFNILS